MRVGGVKAVCDGPGCTAFYQVHREDTATALAREGWLLLPDTSGYYPDRKTFCPAHHPEASTSDLRGES